MMQLLCDGVVLDLYADAALQFTHKNPLFAFDNLECERTTEFKLPSTPTNDGVFALARVPAYKGVGMRRKFTAQLQAGTVVRDGYLYISEYDGKDYKGVFVCGELVELQRIKDMGDACDVLQYDQTAEWNDANAVAANAVTLPNIGIVQHMSDAHYFPSVDLQWLIDEMVTQAGSSVDWNTAVGAKRWRLIMAKDKFVIEDAAVRLWNDKSNPLLPINVNTFLGISQVQRYTSYMYEAEAEWDGQGYDWNLLDARTIETDVMEWQLPYAAEITFPTDTPTNLCVAEGTMPQYVGVAPTGVMRFIRGSRYWTSNPVTGAPTYYGQPLAGRTLRIPANTPFVFVNGDGWYMPKPTYAGERQTVGYDASQAPAFDLTVRMTIDHDFIYGNQVPLQAILPELTATDLLKIYANMCGRLLNFEDGQVRFELPDTSGAPLVLDRLTKRGSVQRTFADYAQKNTVSFESADGVSVFERVRIAYYIDNVNIETEKELAVLPVSEGSIRITRYNGNDYDYVYVREEDDTPTIAEAGAAPYMLHVALEEIAELQALCDASTQYKVECRMLMLEYDKITAKMLLQVDGTRYVWTERSWQGDVAKFTLAKIA